MAASAGTLVSALTLTSATTQSGTVPSAAAAYAKNSLNFRQAVSNGETKQIARAQHFHKKRMAAIDLYNDNDGSGNMPAQKLCVFSSNHQHVIAPADFLLIVIDPHERI